MRMRKKKNFAPRWVQAAAGRLVPDPAAWRGRWLSLVSKAAALHVELGCGKGGFLAACARAAPDTLFVGLERVPEALLMAMEKAEGLPNLRFVAGDAACLHAFFAPGEADRLYVNFCDPWPARKQTHRRLTHRDFLARYRAVLKPGAPLWFKTDNAPLFAFSLEELAAAGARVTFSSDDWRGDPAWPGGDWETEYERRFAGMGVPIRRLEAVW